MTQAFEPRIPPPPGMPHLVRRTAALQNLGWSVADAEWLALACLYSGVFTRHQYRGWHHRDKHAASRFVQRLTAAGVAREHSLPGAVHAGAVLPCLRQKPLPRPRHGARAPTPSGIDGVTLEAPAHTGLPARVSRRELTRHRFGEAAVLPRSRIRRRGSAATPPRGPRLMECEDCGPPVGTRPAGPQSVQRSAPV